MEHVALKYFCNLYPLTSLINKPICWKNPSKASFVDLILKDRPKYFQDSTTIETRQSNFNEILVTILKTTFRKLKPNITGNRKYENINVFPTTLSGTLS